MKRFLPVLLLVFGSSSGCGGKCGPTSPGRECVAFVQEQRGEDCFWSNNFQVLSCSPHYEEVCTEWRC